MHSFEHTLKSVAQINEIFGNQFGTVYHDDPTKLHDYVSGQMSLVVEESEELAQAMAADRHGEILDAIGDIITVVDGIPFKAGFEVTAEHYAELSAELGKGVTEQILTFTPEYFDKNADIHRGEDGLNPTVTQAFLVWKFQRVQVEGVCLNMGFDPKKVYDEVHASNMSKTCANLGEVLETLRKYEENYSLKYVGGDDDMTGRFLEAQPESDLMVQQVAGVYVVKANRAITMSGKLVKSGKFLKGIKFKEPDFSDPSKFKL
ncbi:MAG: hypothetical protein ACRCTP_03900 [Aeromonas popoffii]|uniref:hypothetical protein n=1 Tax=Aeromonas popoffii TaxID=70856 RepID=UPI003F3FB93F